jgi:hypothetical protein
MNFYQLRSMSFIVRIWIEHREIGDQPNIWRGMVEEVSEESPDLENDQSARLPQHLVFTRISDLVNFLTQRMKQLGISDDQINHR